ncbi:MAG: methyltransferase domain-containing protein [Bacteroidota bacterium]
MDLKEALAPGTEVARHPWELARFKVATDLMDKHLQIHTKENLTVLDMGCGDSWFVEQMAERYPKHSYLGVDIAFTDKQLEILEKRLEDSPISLYKELDHASAKLGSTHVDVVLLLDVIEHIEDEISFLKWMQTFPQIDEKTVFLITVPAYQSLWSEHDVFLDHYRRYTNKSLKNRLGQANMQVDKKGYFFSSLIVPRVGQVIREKLTGKNVDADKGVGQWNGTEGQTNMLTNILWTDYRTGSTFRKLGISLPGLSNFALAKPVQPKI